MKKFLVVDPAAPADGAADPSTKTDGTGDGNAAGERALPDDGTHG